MMKTFLSFLTITTFVLVSATVYAQAADDKSKRPSPPAEVSATLAGGAMVTINYNQPSVKGRTIGKDLEPMNGKIWRTGANEATTFTTDKDITIEGSALPAGKYALFTISNEKQWTIIFNKVADQWGAYDYSQEKDALRIQANVIKAEPFAEKLTFTISKTGEISLLWGDRNVTFTAK